ncbi:hypothetical protein F5888DRAFT_1750401, partial [Russula emetica]
PHYELIVLPLRLSTLFICFLARRLEALGKPCFVVPFARVTAREVNRATLAEVYAKRNRHLISRTAPRAQSACVATSSARYAVFKSSAPCCRCLAPHPPHSPLPRPAVRPQLLPPTPAGDLAPTGIDGEVPANPGSRASPLRAPAAWVRY